MKLLRFPENEIKNSHLEIVPTNFNYPSKILINTKIRKKNFAIFTTVAIVLLLRFSQFFITDKNSMRNILGERSSKMFYYENTPIDIKRDN